MSPPKWSKMNLNDPKWISMIHNDPDCCAQTSWKQQCDAVHICRDKKKIKHKKKIVLQCAWLKIAWIIAGECLPPLPKRKDWTRRCSIYPTSVAVGWMQPVGCGAGPFLRCPPNNLQSECSAALNSAAMLRSLSRDLEKLIGKDMERPWKIWFQRNQKDASIQSIF